MNIDFRKKVGLEFNMDIALSCTYKDYKKIGFKAKMTENRKKKHGFCLKKS